MIVKKIYMENFGKFSEKTIEFSDKMTVIEGGNESGKTTIAAFLLAMLFGMEKKRPGEEDEDDLYQKYLPWDNKETYGGFMEFVYDDVKYRLTRNFLQPNRTSLYDVTNAKEIFDGEKEFEAMLGGVTREEYLNSYFNGDGSRAVNRGISQSLKKHLTEEQRANNQEEVDVEYALSLLAEKRLALKNSEAEKKINEIREVIREEEKNERNLDRLAAEELDGLNDLDKLNIELEKFNTPSEFENVEQDYYTHKERYKAYVKDVEKTRELSEQLEKTIIQREELEENAIRLETLREELAAVRSFKKSTDEEYKTTERDMEKKENRMLSDYRNGRYRAMSLLIAAILLIVLGIVFYILNLNGKLRLIVPILVLIPGLVAAVAYAWYMLRIGKEKNAAQEKIDELKTGLEDIRADRKKFFAAHSSEDDLVIRYEAALKTDGLRPEIIAKEQSLSAELSEMDEDLVTRKEELVEFFSKFGPMDILKPDELAVQEEELVKEKEIRLDKCAELKEQIKGLSEQMMKLRIQIEAGDENENKLYSHREQLKAFEEETAKNAKEIEAIELAIRTLESIAGDNHVTVGKILNQRASTYAAEFSGKAYTSFVTDDQMNGKVDRLDKYVSVDKLSRGAEAQMNLALRMAAGDILAEKIGLPIVFDDAFVYYDDERLAGTLKTLGTHDGQKLILSCHGRAETILGQLNVDYEFYTLTS